MLEELKLPYNVIPINIGEGDQFKLEFFEDQPQQQNARNGRSGWPGRRADIDL